MKFSKAREPKSYMCLYLPGVVKRLQDDTQEMVVQPHLMISQVGCTALHSPRLFNIIMGVEVR